MIFIMKNQKKSSSVRELQSWKLSRIEHAGLWPYNPLHSFKMCVVAWFVETTRSIQWFRHTQKKQQDLLCLTRPCWRLYGISSARHVHQPTNQPSEKKRNISIKGPNTFMQYDFSSTENEPLATERWTIYTANTKHSFSFAEVY